MSLVEHTAASLKCRSVELTTKEAPFPSQLEHDHFYFRSQDLTLHGMGNAMEIEIAHGMDSSSGFYDLQHSLNAISCDNEVNFPASGPVAFSSISFDRTVPSTFVVPEITYVRNRAGREWVNIVSIDSTQQSEHILAQSPKPDSGQVTSRPATHSQVISLTRHPSDREYRQNVKRALSKIAYSRLNKVVLGRYVDVEFMDPPDVSAIVNRLADLEPTCTTFHYPIQQGSFLGATPELLVSKRSRSLHCHPLAGTVGLDRLQGDPSAPIATLKGSPKDLSEHNYVVDDIVDRLTPWCTKLSSEAAPSIVVLNSMAHLGTHIRGTLRHVANSSGSSPTVLDLVALLHPTAAVAGIPRDEAIAAIEEMEDGPRGHWAGPVGWVDRNGDGDWMVGIRSATVVGNHARVWAGAGVVAGSTPSGELWETRMKLISVLEALSPGCSRRLSVPW